MTTIDIHAWHRGEPGGQRANLARASLTLLALLVLVGCESAPLVLIVGDPAGDVVCVDRQSRPGVVQRVGFSSAAR